MRLKNAFVVALFALFGFASVSAQSFPTVLHPASWACGHGNCISEDWGGYQIVRSDTGGVSNIVARGIHALGTQPYGVMYLAPPSTTQCCTFISTTWTAPSNATYEVDVELQGRQSCWTAVDPGCIHGPAFGGLQFTVDGSVMAPTFYPLLISNTNSTPTINNNSYMNYIRYRVTLVAGTHTLGFNLEPGFTSQGISGGDVLLGQMVIYQYTGSSSTVKGTCAYRDASNVYHNDVVSGTNVVPMTNACNAKVAGFNGGGRKLNLRVEKVFDNPNGYTGCGASGTIQCELLDIE